MMILSRLHSPPMALPGTSHIYRPSELAEALVDPGWADAGDLSHVVVALSDARRQGESALPARLAELPIPVIGYGSNAPDALLNEMDVVVDDEADLNAVVSQVQAHPQAAAVLVQVLRSTGRLPVPEALVLESLGYATLQSGREFAGWLAARLAAPGRAAADAADVVSLSRRGSRLEIVLDSPDNRNALSTAMRDGLTEAFKLVAMDRSLEAVDVRGNGPSFSAGGDLTEFGTTTDPAGAHDIRMRRMPARYLAARADRYHFHLHGACIGAGIELAAFAARVTAAPDAFFQLPEVAMGLIPGAGGCVSIPRRIGRQRTAYLALTNRRMDAEQALAWGLVDAVANG